MEIRAEHWVAAWKEALAELGQLDVDPDSITCRIGPDGAVEVTAGDEGRRLFVRSLGPGETLQAGRAAQEDAPVTVAAPSTEPTRAPEPARSWESEALPDPSQTLIVDAQAVATAQDISAAPEPPARARIVRKKQGTDRRKRPDPKGSKVGSRLPYAAGFDGGYSTTTREALDMLGRHVRAEATQYLLPVEDGAGWRVDSARGSMSAQLTGALLRSKEPIPGPVDRDPGRRTFAGEGVKVRYSKGLGRRQTFNVKSALWAPIRRDAELVGLLLLLNARRDGGFSDADLSAVRELAQLMATRGGR